MTHTESATKIAMQRLSDDLIRAAQEVFDLHRERLCQWLPFAQIERASAQRAGLDVDEAVHIRVRVDVAQMKTALEILRGFFSSADILPTDVVAATFINEGSAPLVLLHVISSGRGLDESFRFGNSRHTCGGLMGGKESFASDSRRASTDGQQAGTEEPFDRQ